MAALFAFRPRGQKRYGKGVLVIVRNDSSLDRVAHSLPSFIILVVDVPAFNTGMLVDHKQSVGIKRQALATRFVPIQQPSYRITQPTGCLIPAMRQERMERNVKPAIAKFL